MLPPYTQLLFCAFAPALINSFDHPSTGIKFDLFSVTCRAGSIARLSFGVGSSRVYR